MNFFIIMHFVCFGIVYYLALVIFRLVFYRVIFSLRTFLMFTCIDELLYKLEESGLGCKFSLSLLCYIKVCR